MKKLKNTIYSYITVLISAMTHVYVVSLNTAYHCNQNNLVPDEKNKSHVIFHTATITMNWSSYEIHKCMKNASATCECAESDKIRTWNIKMIHAKIGREVAEICFEILQRFAAIDIFPIKPDRRNINWDSGHYINFVGQCQKMKPRDHASVFTYHLLNLLQLGLRYNNEVFMCYEYFEQD